MKTPFSFVLPESFEPGEFLKSPSLRPRFDDARYFISLILTKTARGDVDDCGRVRLHAAYLRNVMHKHQAKAVVDSLVDAGAVTRAPYCPGERSFGYRLSERFLHDKHVRVPATDPRLIARLEAFHETAEADRRSRMKPVHHALERLQYRLRINGDMAREIIAALPPKSNPWDVQGVLVGDIEHRDFHCNVGRFGRLSNSITSMKREVRAALHVDQHRLKHVDISCCQPALIGKTAREEQGGRQKTRQTDQQGQEGKAGADQRETYMMPQLESTSGGDFELYCTLVQRGTFYEFLIAALQQRGVSIHREVLKRKFLADVIAKRKANSRGAEYPSVVEDVFADLFPEVYAYIRRVNRDGWEHGNLIRELQRQESRLVIETIAADLVARHPGVFFITLHDAIYSTAEHLPKIQEGFQRAFEQIAFPMAIKVA